MKSYSVPSPRTRLRARSTPRSPWPLRAGIHLLALAGFALASPPSNPGLAEALTQIDGSIQAEGRTPNANVNLGPALSGDGRYFAFITSATDIVPNQTAEGGSAEGNLFLRDRVTGTTKLISKVLDTTTTTAGGCSHPSISRDGRYLCFLSNATNLVSEPTSGQQVFLYDQETGQVTLVTRNAYLPTVSASDSSSFPQISADGSKIIFNSLAPDLTNTYFGAARYPSTFCWDRATGLNRLVSARQGKPYLFIDATATVQSVSTNGRWVVFSTKATNVVAGQQPSDLDSNLFLADTTGELPTVLCNHALGSPTTPGNAPVFGTVSGVSADGRFVTYASAATDLVSGHTTEDVQIFLYDRLTDSNRLVSHAAGNPEVCANYRAIFSVSNTSNLVMSDDGRHVVFTSAATNLVPGYANINPSNQAYLYDRLGNGGAGANTLITRSTDLVPGLVFGSSTGILTDVAISGNGERAVLSTSATDLVSGLHFGATDIPNVYAYTIGATHHLTLVSGTLFDRLTTSKQAAFSPAVTAAGNLAIFLSSGADFARNDLNNLTDYFGVVLPPIVTTPVITSVSLTGGTYRAGDALEFKVQWSAPVTVTGQPLLTLVLGGAPVSATYDAAASTETSLVFKYTIQPGDVDLDGIGLVSPLKLNGGTILAGQDLEAALTFDQSLLEDITIDSTSPKVTSVSVPEPRVYRAGHDLDFVVNFSEDVIISTKSGQPTLAVTIGNQVRDAVCISGDGTSALTFRYTTQDGDSDDDGITLGASIALNGSFLDDSVGNPAELGLHEVGATTEVLVDAVAPVVASVAVPAAGSYKAGQLLDFTVTLSESVIVDTQTVMPVISFEVGGRKRYAYYVSGSGSNQLLFRHKVLFGDDDNDGISLAGSIGMAVIQDAAGNSLVPALNNVPSTAGIIVDTRTPMSPSAPVLAAGDDTGPSDSDRITSRSSTSLSGTAEDGTTVRLFANGVEIGSAVATGGAWSIAVKDLGEGTYTFTTTATDIAGNTSLPSEADQVVIDLTAPTVAIGAPSDSLTGPGPVRYVVTYSDTNFAGSTLTENDVTLHRTGTANGKVSITGRGTEWKVTISDIVGNGTLGISLAAGSAQDLAGHSAPAFGPSETFTVVNNQNPVATNDGPLTVIEPNAATLDLLGNDTDADKDTLKITSVTQGAHGTVTIANDGQSVEFQPAAGYHGADEFSYTISDGHDGTATGTVTVQITDGGPEGYQQTVLLVGGSGLKGDAVAGEQGATYSRLRSPSINDAGHIAATVLIRGAGKSYRAVVAGNPPTIVARAGQAAPGTNSKFTTFGAPSLTENGKVVFVARLSGAEVTTTNAYGLYGNVGKKGLEQIVRLGTQAHDLPRGVRYSRFNAVSASDSFVAFVAKLQGDASVVDSTNDRGLWMHHASTTKLVLRKGQVLPQAGSRKIASLISLKCASKPLGQAATINGSTVDALVKFTDNTSAWLRVGMETAPIVLLQDGDKFGNDAVKSIVDSSTGTDGITGTAVLNLSTGSGVAVHDTKEISLAAATGDKLAGPHGAVLTSVTAATADRMNSVGFLGTFTADGFAKPAVGLVQSKDGVHQVLAYQGGMDAESTHRWVKFNAFALPRSLGPLFEAQTEAKGQLGRSLWATDRGGELLSLVEKGEDVQIRETVRKVIGFEAVAAAKKGSVTRRTFNQRRQVVYLAKFRDGTQAIIRADIP